MWQLLIAGPEAVGRAMFRMPRKPPPPGRRDDWFRERERFYPRAAATLDFADATRVAE